jgi:hypothetical protein
MDILSFCRQRLKHPVGRIYYSYMLFVLVVVIVAMNVPVLQAHNQWILMLWYVPYFVAIPAVELLLLIRERRLVQFVRRFWSLWPIVLSGPVVFYVIALQQRWVLHCSIAWLVYPAFVFPFVAAWCKRVFKLGWL